MITTSLFIHLLSFARLMAESPQQRVAPLRESLTVPLPMRDTPPHQGTTSPTLYEQCVGSKTSHRIYMCKGCETGPAAYHPYRRRLGSLTVCRSLYKGSTFSSVI